MALQQLKQACAELGFRTHVNDEVEAFLARATVRAIMRGRITSRTCRRCGRPLTDPASMATGIGPECAGKASTEAALDATYPAGTMVRIIAGPEAGKVGRVQGIKHGASRPLRVWIAAGWYAVWASADQVEPLGDEPTDLPALEMYDRVKITGDGLAGRVGTVLERIDDEESGGVESYYVELDPEWEEPETPQADLTYPIRAEHLRKIGGAA